MGPVSRLQISEGEGVGKVKKKQQKKTFKDACGFSTPKIYAVEV